MAKKQKSKKQAARQRLAIELPLDVYKWLCEVARSGGSAANKVAAAILLDVKTDDERAHGSP